MARKPWPTSPLTGLAYIPINALPGFYADDDVDLKNWKRTPGIVTGIKPFELANLDEPDNTPLGSLQAWDPVHQKSIWSVPLLSPTNGGVLATAGGLVFQGQADGVFAVRSADTGALLWSFDGQNGMKAQPISYSVNGTQYVTLVTGFGGPPTAFGPLAARFNWDYRSQKRRILTFALGGSAQLPPRDPVHRDKILDEPSPGHRCEASAGRAHSLLSQLHDVAMASRPWPRRRRAGSAHVAGGAVCHGVCRRGSGWGTARQSHAEVR